MIIHLENEKLAVTLSSFGGTIESIINKETGNEHYWKFDSDVWPRSTNICFPVCNGLTGGCYFFEGKKYDMPVHGFLRECDMAVEEQSATKAVLTLRPSDKTKEIYPFDFLFILTQELRGSEFHVSYTVENIGSEDLYYSVGSHYCYKIPIVTGEDWDDYEYRFHGSQKAGKLLIEDGQVSGKTDDIFNGKDHLKLENFFENGSTMLDLSDIKSHEIALASNRSDAYTNVRFEGFDHCVLWAPKDRFPFACIEPWSGTLDQKGHDGNLKNKAGITKLGTKEHRTYTQIITVK